MSYEIEEFITDAINMKLLENFGGSWTVIVVKWPIGGLARSGIPWNGTPTSMLNFQSVIMYLVFVKEKCRT